ncbi:hypothetical protein RRG08_047833 [Elysia crispata]|uniref:Uncharacterized protein n=1 Tax=Elysia crispata TaxID=231223 RepID=A0AAE0ZXP3_9GAST|nr:hypothetical protein RRG08_047833 [Elysia crispata]
MVGLRQGSDLMGCEGHDANDQTVMADPGHLTRIGKGIELTRDLGPDHILFTHVTATTERTLLFNTASTTNKRPKTKRKYAASCLAIRAISENQVGD